MAQAAAFQHLDVPWPQTHTHTHQEPGSPHASVQPQKGRSPAGSTGQVWWPVHGATKNHACCVNYTEMCYRPICTLSTSQPTLFSLISTIPINHMDRPFSVSRKSTAETIQQRFPSIVTGKPPSV